MAPYCESKWKDVRGKQNYNKQCLKYNKRSENT